MPHIIKMKTIEKEAMPQRIKAKLGTDERTGTATQVKETTTS